MKIKSLSVIILFFLCYCSGHNIHEVEDPCKNIDCGDGGECIATEAGFAYCSCSEGYHLENGKCVSDRDGGIDIRDIEDIEDTEDIEDIKDAQDIEDIEDVQDIEDIEDAEDIEDIEDAQDIEDIEDVQDIEDIEDAQDIEDIEDTQQEIECIDEDGDGYGQGCSNGDDCDDNNPFVWVSCDSCTDDDGDRYWTGCDGYSITDQDHLGEDCNDTTPLCNVDCSDNNNNGTLDCLENCNDNDGDGYGVGQGCLGEDVCDDDRNNWTQSGCNNCADNDGDNYYVNCDTYVTIDGPDCNDNDRDNWESCNSCLDNDGDTFFFGCDAYNDHPGPDCDDTDPDNWLNCANCVDNDGDGFFVGCDAYNNHLGPDCDDNNDQIHPGASRFCSFPAYDYDCSGFLDREEGCITNLCAGTSIGELKLLDSTDIGHKINDIWVIDESIYLALDDDDTTIAKIDIEISQDGRSWVFKVDNNNNVDILFQDIGLKRKSILGLGNNIISGGDQDNNNYSIYIHRNNNLQMISGGYMYISDQGKNKNVQVLRYFKNYIFAGAQKRVARLSYAYDQNDIITLQQEEIIDQDLGGNVKDIQGLTFNNVDYIAVTYNKPRIRFYNIEDLTEYYEYNNDLATTGDLGSFVIDNGYIYAVDSNNKELYACPIESDNGKPFVRLCNRIVGISVIYKVVKFYNNTELYLVLGGAGKVEILEVSSYQVISSKDGLNGDCKALFVYTLENSILIFAGCNETLYMFELCECVDASESCIEGLCCVDDAICGVDDQGNPICCYEVTYNGCGSDDECCGSAICESNVCCYPAGINCTDNNQCCGTAICDPDDSICCYEADRTSDVNCGSDNECCDTAICDNGFCCYEPNVNNYVGCTSSNECCGNGVCGYTLPSGTVIDEGKCCLELGVNCTSDVQCCGNDITNGGDPVVECGEVGSCCVTVGNRCRDNSDCCTGHCSMNICYCLDENSQESCQNDYECCEGYQCENNRCCKPNGASCFRDEECCSDNCDRNGINGICTP